MQYLSPTQGPMRFLFSFSQPPYNTTGSLSNNDGKGDVYENVT